MFCVLATLKVSLPDWNIYILAGYCWLGFILPTNISSVIFDGAEPRWLFKKMAVMTFGSLTSIQAVALVYYFF